MNKTEQTPKQKALESIARLPDDANWGDILYRVYILHGLAKADEQIAKRETVSHEEIVAEIEAERSAAS